MFKSSGGYTSVDFLIEVIIMGNPFFEIANKLRKAPNEICNIAIPKLQPDADQSLQRAIDNYYGFWGGVMYSRTGNFRNWTAKLQHNGGGNCSLILDNGAMSDYPSIIGGSPLTQEGAMQLMFKGGEHGHGRFQAGVSTPPHDIIERDVQSGFNGKLSIYINQAIDQVLGSL